MSAYLHPTTRRTLSAIESPRTIPELAGELPDVGLRKIQATVYNAVTRGRAQNLKIEQGRKCGGLFVSVAPDRQMEPQFAGLLGVWR